MVTQSDPNPFPPPTPHVSINYAANNQRYFTLLSVTHHPQLRANVKFHSAEILPKGIKCSTASPAPSSASQSKSSLYFANGLISAIISIAVIGVIVIIRSRHYIVGIPIDMKKEAYGSQQI